jgi:hypothetical protein
MEIEKITDKPKIEDMLLNLDFDNSKDEKKYFVQNSTYTDNFSFSTTPNYSSALKYFIPDDKYKKFRNKTVSHIAPFINSTRANLGCGLYGVCYTGLGEIYINHNNSDTTEVIAHEHIHLSNPNLSEREVRYTIRVREENTRYH